VVVQLKSLIRQVAASDITALITGESGTGKELVARAIHELSPRRRAPMVTINCGAIPEGIFESEVFGHEKGSFTSADQRRQGYFEMADKGTIFLDEIGEMPLAVQVKLLRVLEAGRFLRVGGSRELQVDVRVIAATNKDLGVEVTVGRFRSDLFYRLKAVSINLPPLRERPEDIPTLARHFARDFSVRNNRPEPQFEPEALHLLKRGYWSGNVRELKNLVESFVALSPAPIIRAEIVRARLGSEAASPNLPMIVTRSSRELDNDLIYRTLLDLRQEISALRGSLQQLLVARGQEIDTHFAAAEVAETLNLGESEREQIRKALAKHQGNRRESARALGIGERTLYRKIKLFGLE
jgi:DNA-binding NtrC family response regulator